MDSLGNSYALYVVLTFLILGPIALTLSRLSPSKLREFLHDPGNVPAALVIAIVLFVIGAVAILLWICQMEKILIIPGL